LSVVLTAPFAVASRVALPGLVAAPTVAVNIVKLAPPGICTDAGTVTTELFDETAIKNPLAPALPPRVIVH
jgi:hypothetical protein